MITLTEIQYRHLMQTHRTVERHLAKQFKQAVAQDRRLTMREALARVQALVEVRGLPVPTRVMDQYQEIMYG